MPSLAQLRPAQKETLAKKTHVDLPQDAYSCATCAAFELNLCAAVRKKAEPPTERHPGTMLLQASTHTIPARRTICHPNEWSEFVPFICRGWAASSIALPDGRRQILKFLLPGDIVSTACLFEPTSGRMVEAVTEVSYRNFKRSDLQSIFFKHADLFERISRTWIEERAQADQLAVDLGRRTSEERLARLILNLMEALAKRAMARGHTMEFPLRQRHIADATGLTPVHVSKVLGEFQRAGLIEISDRSLTILNLASLRRVADRRW
jgi:CRP-like cAMP-binding protein